MEQKTKLTELKNRVFENPKVKDRVTLLKSANETDGQYTLAEVELSPGGGTPVHYHKSFSEKFLCVEGTLGVEVNGRKIFLKPSESAVAPVGSRHRFFNPTSEKTKFHVTIFPASTWFEYSLAIGYGLARDGYANEKGVPRKFTHIAILFIMSDTNLPGILTLIEPIMRWRANWARKKGITNDLIKRYAS